MEVAINRTLTLDLKLELARQSERVEVRAPLRTLDPSRSSVSHVVTAREIETIPLNGRNYLDLVLLTPGAISSNARTELADRDTRGAIFGERGGNTAFLIDGFENNDDVRGGVFQNYTQDAIQEFEVISAGYKAEFGRGSGGVVNVITKSGGNDLTGTGVLLPPRRCARRVERQRQGAARTRPLQQQSRPRWSGDSRSRVVFRGDRAPLSNAADRFFRPIRRRS